MFTVGAMDVVGALDTVGGREGSGVGDWEAEGALLELALGEAVPFAVEGARVTLAVPFPRRKSTAPTLGGDVAVGPDVTLGLSDSLVLGAALTEGEVLGVSVGPADGSMDGNCDAVSLGDRLRLTVGDRDVDGRIVGPKDGAIVGPGESDGTAVPLLVEVAFSFVAVPFSAVPLAAELSCISRSHSRRPSAASPSLPSAKYGRDTTNSAVAAVVSSSSIDGALPHLLPLASTKYLLPHGPSASILLLP